MDDHGIPKPPMVKNPSNVQMGLPTNSIQDIQEDHIDTTEFGSDVSSDPEDDSNMLKMFEAYSDANSKGAPGSECRTSTRLVSPASGHGKKKWNPLILPKIRYLELNYNTL